ncbi:MAG: hypothetical protein M1305_07425 [Candidatus Marsarchaeota archaeon]|nr:hypothetical protein [Candidatus Marsarchaeota archaeon]
MPSDNFDRLAKRTNSLVIGPRGSGKTTLLRMLQGPALEAWNDAEADRYRKCIDFTGVFIATDPSWAAQIQMVGGWQVEQKYRRILTTAAFTTNVLRRLIVTMEYRAHPPDDPILVSHLRVGLNQEAEAQLVRGLAGPWGIKPELPSLLSLKYALSARLMEIHSLRRKEELLDPAGRAERFAAVGWLHLPLLQSATLAVDLFEDCADGDPGGRWAFLFDEMELAPKWINQDLMNSLRSADERFLFKLSMSPYNEDVNNTSSALSAMPGHDYEEIPLWYAHKEEGYPFCRALLRSMLKERGIQDVDPESLFGISEFETPTTERTNVGGAYKPGSRLQRRFARMARKDKSFGKYLEHRCIDPKALHLLDDNVRASDIRKITSLVAVRDAFRRYDRQNDDADRKNRRQQIRSRKNPQVYAGASSLFAMVEGNPRWFIGIVDRLLSDFSKLDGKLSAATQVEEVLKTVHLFRALLAAIPCPEVAEGQNHRGALSILDLIGEHFFKSVVVDDFNPDPPGSFTIDSDANEELVYALGQALNAGAIVYVPEKKSILVLRSLREKRFRLSYLLAPYYRIPVRLGRPISLSSVVRESSTERTRRAERWLQQGLFPDVEQEDR